MQVFTRKYPGGSPGGIPWGIPLGDPPGGGGPWGDLPGFSWGIPRGIPWGIPWGEPLGRSPGGIPWGALLGCQMFRPSSTPTLPRPLAWRLFTLPQADLSPSQPLLPEARGSAEEKQMKPPKSTHNPSRIVPGSTPNRPRINPGSIQNLWESTPEGPLPGSPTGDPPRGVPPRGGLLGGHNPTKKMVVTQLPAIHFGRAAHQIHTAPRAGSI